MNNVFSNNTKIIAGEKALEYLTFELQQYGVKRPFLLCDDMSYRLGNLAELLKAFDGFDIRFQYIDTEIDDLATVEKCEKLLKQFRSNDCDGIVALGRKAVVASAKCLKIMLKDGTSFLSTYEKNSISQHSIMKVPLFVVPTNLASGQECKNSINIHEPKANKIYTFSTSFARTTGVIIDGRMTDIMPSKAISSYGLYALSAGIFAFLESDDKLYVKPYAKTAIEIVRDNLAPCILHNADKKYRTNIMTAVVLGGLALDCVGDSIVNEIVYAIVNRYNVNFANVYMLIFRQYFMMHEWNPARLEELLLPLVGEQEYSACNPVARKEKAQAEMAKIFDYVDEIVATNSNLKTLGIEKSSFTGIAESVIASHYKENDTEATYRFIVELLERAYSD